MSGWNDARVGCSSLDKECVCGEDDIDQTEGMKGNINALSGLIHHYGKERKSVHWGDKV